MTKNTILILLSLFIISTTYAQGWQWGRGTTGGNMDSWPVATDLSGNIFVAGVNFRSGWNGGSGSSIAFGSYILPDNTLSNSGLQCVISKYDTHGNFLWANGTQNGDTYLMSIATDRAGNSFLFGTINSQTAQVGSYTLTNTSFPDNQYFLAKFDPAGNVIWVKNEGNAQGAYVEILFASFVLGTGGVTTDASGNIFITANFHLPTVSVGSFTLTNSDPSGHTDDILLAKYDSSGNVVWATSSGNSGSDDAYGITVTPAGDIYISGIFNSPQIIFGASTIVDESGGVGNAFIARYNSSGIPTWGASSGGLGSEFAAGVAADAVNNVYLTGGVGDSSISFSDTIITNPFPDRTSLYLVKFDPSNNVSWYKTIGDSSGYAWGYCIAMSPCGAIWVSGSFTDSVNIDGHVLNAPAESYDPVFIAGFSSAGEYVESAALQSGADDQNGIACDASGNVYMCADYIHTEFNFVVNNDTLANIDTGNSIEWQYLAKYTFINNASPDTFSTHEDVYFCPNQSISINAPAGYTNYLWNNGSMETSFDIDTLGTYWVTGTGICTIIDTINAMYSESCYCKVVLPNAFTPNGDSKNDTYSPIFESGCYITDYSFSIFNRWGQQVFHCENPSAQWDGTFQGIKAEMGTYMYYLKYNSGASNKPYTAKGDVTLIR